MKRDSRNWSSSLIDGLQPVTISWKDVLSALGVRKKRKGKEFDWNDNLRRVLFRCWVEVAVTGAWRKSLKYFLISMGMALLSGMVRDHALAERLKVVIPIMLGFSLLTFIAHFGYMLVRRKVRTSTFYYLSFPLNLKELFPLQKIGKPDDLKTMSDAKFVKFLMDRFKEEFSYWTDRVKNGGVIFLAASVFMGLWYRNNNDLLDFITIVSSYMILISYYVSRATQRAMRYLSYRVLILENQEQT